MSMKKLKTVIRTEWGVSYKQIDKDIPLIALAETIACDSEKCTVEEAYGMYIDEQIKELHLPGLIAFCIIDEMGLDPHKVNVTMSLRSLFDL